MKFHCALRPRLRRAPIQADKASKAMLALSVKKPFPAKIQKAFADGDANSTENRIILGTITKDDGDVVQIQQEGGDMTWWVAKSFLTAQ